MNIFWDTFLIFSSNFSIKFLMRAIIALIYRNFLFFIWILLLHSIVYSVLYVYEWYICILLFFPPSCFSLFWFMLFRAVQISESNSILGLGNERELLVVVSGESIKILHVGFYIFSIFLVSYSYSYQCFLYSKAKTSVVFFSPLENKFLVFWCGGTFIKSERWSWGPMAL